MLAVTAAALLTGCLLEDPLPSRGKPRQDCDRQPSEENAGSGGNAEADTAVYISAVRFPQSYDWRVDSARGAAEYEVLLLRDSVEILTIPSSSGVVSPDPDTHHIIGGHLYTEAIKDGSTVICRDGQTLFSFEGCEILKGLLPCEEGIYTLSATRDGESLVLRRDGVPLLERKAAIAFGDLLDPSYGSTGALYDDAGELCFCYSKGRSQGKSCYVVRGTVENTACDGDGVSDLKVYGSKVFAAMSRMGPYSIEDGRIWTGKDGPWISGYFSKSGYDGFSGLLSQDFEDIRLSPQRSQVYHCEVCDVAVTASSHAGMQIRLRDGKMDLGQDCFLMTPVCAAACGRFFAALTTRSSDVQRIIAGERSFTLNLHGYLSGIEVSPPN